MYQHFGTPSLFVFSARAQTERAEQVCCPETTILYLLILSLLGSFPALAGKSFPTAFEHLLALVLRAVLGLGVYLNQTVIHNLLNFCEHCKVMPFQLQAEENATEIQYFSPIS